MTRDLAAIKAGLSARAETLCRVLLPGGKIEAGEFVASGSETGFGKVAVVLKGGKCGRVGFWAGRPDDPSKDGGDLIHLIMAVNRLRLGEAIRWAEEWLGGRPAAVAERPERPAPERSEDERRAWMEKRALSLFELARPGLGGTVAEIYLRQARGVDFDFARFSDDVRFHPRLEWWRGGRREGGRRIAGPCFPAIVLASRNAAGDFLGAHCTFLRHDGRGKADVEAAKLMMGSANQGWITLETGAPGGSCAVNEGFENGATMMMASGPGHWHFVAPSLSALKRIVFPAECAGALLFPHNDWGNEAALRQFKAARAALEAQGKPVKVLRPQGVNDPNDVVKPKGE